MTIISAITGKKLKIRIAAVTTSGTQSVSEIRCTAQLFIRWTILRRTQALTAKGRDRALRRPGGAEGFIIGYQIGHHRAQH